MKDRTLVTITVLAVVVAIFGWWIYSLDLCVMRTPFLMMQSRADGTVLVYDGTKCDTVEFPTVDAAVEFTSTYLAEQRAR